MQAQESPFRPYWWGISLEDAGVEGRPDVGTYGRYEFAQLPPVPFAMNGDLAWLAAQPVQDDSPVGEDDVEELPHLVAACERLGLTLPPAFVRFVGSVDLQRRVRSSTACYVDVTPEPARSPVGDGYLVRFLADQQGCLFWYLYLTADGTDHAVVSSEAYFGTPAENEGVGDDEPAEIEFCGESFEVFLCRYWLENEIWFADNDGTPMPAVGAEYLKQYTALA